jgi:photosystem II stability/assembly factor-like uncharacterized protein
MNQISRFFYSAALIAGSFIHFSNFAGEAWEPVGLGGGGSMFTPAYSPADPKLLMLNCDMSGAYLSRDGGKTWRLVHHAQLRGNTRCRPAFHPTDPKIIFAASGWSGRLKVSRDGGERWADIGNLPSGLCGEIVLDPDFPARMLVGVNEEVWRSENAGGHWTRCVGPQGAAVAFHFERTSPVGKRTCFAATSGGVWRSDDGGATWAEKMSGLPAREVRGFAGGSDAKSRTVVLYCALPGRNVGGRYVGGVWRSEDRGEQWVSAMGANINQDVKAADQWAMADVAQYHQVLVADVKPFTVYALNSNTGVWPPHHTAAWRSDDGGKTWRATFFPDPRFKEFNAEHDWHTAALGQYYQETPYGAAIDPKNPDRVLVCGSMRCAYTEDGGRSWKCAQAAPAAPGRPDKNTAWKNNGLVVTTAWNYYVDPHQPVRHYIAYTDIGFARSSDAGRSWTWWGPGEKPPWRNTCYELAFDPDFPGKIWGAFSDVHDIPNGNIIWERHRTRGGGGVCLSVDFGGGWTKSNSGLPEAPVTGIVLDGRSPKGRRTLYAGVFDGGAFKSEDDGKTWVEKNRGLGGDENRRVCRIFLHADGTLFALVTAKRRGGNFQAAGVGLYRSLNGGEQWEWLNRARPLLWPKDFAADPRDSRVILLGAADAGNAKEGGLYVTTDGGATWRKIVREGAEHFGASFHPQRPGLIYMTLCEGAPGAGLWASADGGKTWRAFDALPFSNVMRVTFDPADPGRIFATTFGGSVWRGPATP